MKRNVFYGVLLKKGRLALGKQYGPALFYRKTDACKFRDELIPHLSGYKGKVVCVSMEWEVAA